MANSVPTALSKLSQKSFIAYYKNAQNMNNITRDETRSRLERIDRLYQRETNLTEEQRKAKAANRAGDATRYQDITVPVIMPQVEAAVTYQASVYLSSSKMFEVEASPAFMVEALQLDTILQNQVRRGGWQRELIMFFRDGFKYNFAPLEVTWVEEVSYEVETNLKADLKTGQPKKVIWAGNKLKRLDPYNVIVDTRVPASEVYKDGEFAGYTEFMSRIRLKALIASLPEVLVANIVPAFESGVSGVGSGAATNSGSLNYYVPSINPDVAEENYKGAGTNWLAWAGFSTIRKTNIDYKDGYEVSTFYARILPSEFDLRIPNNNTPQIYKLIIVNHEHIIYAELQTNAHNYLGILIGQPAEDGLSYQTKSLADNGEPFQDLASAYMSSIIASRRRAVSDRLLYAPSRVTSAQINNSNPSAKIPVRPAAYGKNLAEAVYQFPYREDQAAVSMQQISTIIALANTLNGQNQVSQGQFIKGNKTDGQFSETIDNANGRDQLSSILLEHQVFVPMKLMLKLNILQFQGGTSLFNRDENREVEIDPVALRKAVLDFKLSDGLTKREKTLRAEPFAAALQVMGSSPQIAAEYNSGQLFSYLMKTQGADLTPFEKSQEQIAYEQALGAWQQLATLAIEKDQEFKQPQPLPEQFGYNPQDNKPAPDAANEEPNDGNITT